MSKYDVVIFLLVVIFSVSGICGHFGYEVDGSPRGVEGYLRNEYAEWQEANYGLDVTFEFWQDQFADTTVIGEVVAAFVFIVDMCSFSIDDMPEVLSLIFLLLNLLTLYLLISTVWK